MSLSKIIKQPAVDNQGTEVLSVDPVQGESGGGGFLTLDSLWQSTDGGVSSFASVQARKEQLQQEAEEIVKNAESRATQIEQDAYEKGHEKGFAEGLEKGNEQGHNEVVEKVQQVEKLLVEIGDERKSLYGEYEKDIVELVKTVVEKIVNHEVSVNPRVILACLKNSLKYVVENSMVKVHLNSNDFVRIKEAGLEDSALLDGLSQLELVEDQSISEGGCLLETEFGEVDATLENRKERILEVIDRSFMQGLAEG